MDDRECIGFLQWALPRMQMRWRGFRRVRRQVCKRVARRLEELGLPDARAYRAWLEGNPGEWDRLDPLCRITISRFWRDAGVFEHLRREVLPALAERAARRDDGGVRCWSAGCASGEEPYSLALAWEHRPGGGSPHPTFAVVATDAGPAMIERARGGLYPASSLRDLPPEWVTAAFEREGERYRLRAPQRRVVDFHVQDLRTAMPEGPFDLVLCRNLVFTYFIGPLQRSLLERLRARLRPEGVLVIGSHESLPGGVGGWSAWPGVPGVFRREARAAPEGPPHCGPLRPGARRG